MDFCCEIPLWLTDLVRFLLEACVACVARASRDCRCPGANASTSSGGGATEYVSYNKWHRGHRLLIDSTEQQRRYWGCQHWAWDYGWERHWHGECHGRRYDNSSSGSC